MNRVQITTGPTGSGKTMQALGGALLYALLSKQAVLYAGCKDSYATLFGRVERSFGALAPENLELWCPQGGVSLSALLAHIENSPKPYDLVVVDGVDQVTPWPNGTTVGGFGEAVREKCGAQCAVWLTMLTREGVTE